MGAIRCASERSSAFPFAKFSLFAEVNKAQSGFYYQIRRLRLCLNIPK